MFTLSRCNTALHDNTLPQKQMAFTFPLGGSEVQVPIHLASLPPEVMGGPDPEPHCQPISERGEHRTGTSAVLPLTNTPQNPHKQAQNAAPPAPAHTHMHSQAR